MKVILSYLFREDVASDVLEDREDDLVPLDLVDQPHGDVGLLRRPQLVVPVRQELLKAVALGPEQTGYVYCQGYH